MFWLQVLLCAIHFSSVYCISFTTSISANNSYTFGYFWDKCMGGGNHAVLALRSDWRSALKACRDTFGLQSVRFHGILNDPVGSFNGYGDYSFVNVDKIYDYILSIGVHPYVEISFMPDQLASDGTKSYPKSYREWRYFISNLTQHLLDRYDATYDIKKHWLFEIWNEPNQNDFEGYLSLYSNTSRAIKAVSTDLKVGGPATAQMRWLDIFVNATMTNNIPIDFVSSHLYPTDPACNWTQYGIDTFKTVLQQKTANISQYDNGELSFYLSEFDSGHSNGNNNRDDEYAASFMIFMAKSLQDLLIINGGEFGWLAWWKITDIDEKFISAPFRNGYGLQTIRGIKKPVFRVFQLLADYGSEIAYKTLKIENSPNDETVMLYVLKNNKTNSNANYTIFAANWNDKALNITAQSVSVTVENVIENKMPKAAILYRIDANNTNPFQVWQSMGSPQYPTQQQLDKLNIASQLVPNTMKWNVVNSNTIVFNFTMPAYSVVAINLQY